MPPSHQMNPTMLGQLNVAITTLEVAVDGYLKICQDIFALYVDGQPTSTIPYGVACGFAKQLPIIESLRGKLGMAHSIVGHSRNASSSLVPIHGLPSEILSRIFSLVLGDNCINHPEEFSLYYSSSPRLMSVCKYWHQVVTHSSALWTRIDLTVYDGCATTAPRMDLAKLYVERAAQMTLEVHIIELGDGGSPKHTASLVPFLTSIAHRVSSFLLNSNTPILYRSALAALFNNCTPGTLTTLDMRIRQGARTYALILDQIIDWRLKPSGDTRATTADTPEERFEQIFQGVNILRLGCIYPTRRWASGVYHGLVELRCQWGPSIRVTESQFVEILRQSPRLRILECSSRLDLSPLEGGAPINSIPLNDLEAVNFGDSDRNVENIVRWLAPGSKPLQIFLRTFKPGPHLRAFISRSNITRLYCKYPSKEDLMNIVHRLPHLQSLALGNLEWGRSSNSGESQYKIEKKLPSSLVTLYLIKMGHSNLHHEPLRVHLRPLHTVLFLESLRHVVLYRCVSDSEDFVSTFSELDLPRIEFAIAPEGEPNPVDDWELFSPRSHE
ncbi:unnamed protein product [Rhizoctonia solani]|uniref:F-box domain-containing protein n=1 Tax=Rhizoctonia solani TaxID=456999 RepID=A0A8H3HEZ6_9AGAM|nr:unnamed protein product [Rhizoctonia solani]